MTYSKPARTTTRRIPRILVAGLLVVIAAIAASRHLLNNDEDRSSLLSDKGRSSLLDDKDRAYLSTDGWPLRGQGAYVLGNGRPAVSPHQQPVRVVLEHEVGPEHQAAAGRLALVLVTSPATGSQ